MKTTSIYALICAASLASSAAGCYRTRIDVGHGPMAALHSSADKGNSDDTRFSDGSFYHDFLFGLVEVSGPLKLSQICPNGVDHIEQEVSFLAGLVASLTSNIYTPLEVEVVCRDGSSARVKADDLPRLAQSSK